MDQYTLEGATFVLDDRERAYPILMSLLLPPGVLGLVLASLLAAFMSTVDTHLNWGASYIVNDGLLKIFPQASDQVQIRVAKMAVVLFVLISLVISFFIGTIETGWRAVATVGAAFGIPTLLRWFWWRLNADAEFLAIASGIAAGGALALFTEISYELRLILTAGCSLGGVLAGVYWGAPNEFATLDAFKARVNPIGFWPDRSISKSLIGLSQALLKWILLCWGLIHLLMAFHDLLFMGGLLFPIFMILSGGALVYLAISGLDRLANR